ncbi:site-specific integrase [Alistipes sp. AF17-16]|uniref:tyrosine-type recombinase/integrase n=1 Tax=Alistipes TaxID=239759 RepID=UPI000E4CBFA4|nr:MULTISPECIES: site-specific integrase [Alistipes]RHR64368.1 site-specific integrase [Alistipes sp. AF17-16]
METINKYVTATLRLDKRRLLKKSNKYPIRLEIYFHSTIKRYSTRYLCTEIEWKKINAKHLYDENLKEIRLGITEIQNKANKIIKTLGANFSFEGFDRLYLGIEAKPFKDKQNVYDAFRRRSNELMQEHRFGTAKSYKNALVSLMKYKNRLNFSDVTVNFLKGYERFMLQQNRSTTTIAMYMRYLRAIVNEAIADEIMSADQYPFGSARKRKYEIPETKKVNSALDLDGLKAIINYKPEFESEAKARDLWLFSFYCCGMNMKDIYNLKYANLQNGFIVFYRQKTIRTRRTHVPIQVFITKPVQDIIDFWGNEDKSLDNYIFGIYKKTESDERNYELGKLYTHVINERMKEIGKKVDIHVSLTTYVARHTYATTLMRKGVNIAFISESLGHTSLKTTESYLDGFRRDDKMEIAAMLTKIAE